MRVTNLFALLAIAAMTPAASATTVTLIDFQDGAASVGNGALFNPQGTATTTGFAAPPALNENANGRTLTGGGNLAIDEGNLSNLLPSLLDNQGIIIDGFTAFRGTITGGNPAFGFLENGGRLSDADAPSDGHAFANSGEIALLSDVYTPGAFTSVSWRYEGGADTTGGLGSTTNVNAYLIIDGGLPQLVDSTTINGIEGTVVSGTEALAGSSIQFLLVGDGGTAVRTLYNDISLTVEAIPEPNAIALSLLALTGFGAVGMRRRLG